MTTDSTAPAPDTVPFRPRTAARILGVVAGLVALAASVALFFRFRPLGHAVFEYPDLEVYRQAGRRLLDGRSLYASPPRTLPFTYPPFAAVLSVVFALPPRRVVMLGWFVTNIALLAWVLRTCFRPALDRVPVAARPAALLSLTAVMFWLRPVNDTLDWGQINLLLLALVLADGLGRSPLPRGVLVGVAAAVKLVPGIFIGYFLAARQWRAAITATVSAGVCILVALVLAPSSSWRYWTETIFESGRIGDSRFYSNQSLLGIVQRTVSDPWAGPVWAVLVLVVLVVGFRRVARAQRDGDVLAALALTGLMGCLVSPISWFHHFVWVLPAVAVLVDDGRNRTRVLVAAGVALLVTTSLPYIGIHLVDSESPLAAVGWVLENSVGLLTLALVFLLPHRRYPAPVAPELVSPAR